MAAPRIDSYRFGRIVVDGRSHDQDVIILPNRVLAGWWRQEGHALHPSDIKTVLEVAPEVLVVGQGASRRMRIKRETRDVLQNAGIELVACPTEEACQIYNTLCEKRSVAAALHLTC